MLNEMLTDRKPSQARPTLSMLGQHKAQVGETVTWVVATVIIIVILAVSIFVASITFGGLKEFTFIRQADSLATKSYFSYLLTKDANGKTVYEQLKDEENLNNFNGNLALGIFKEFYEEEYFSVWVGLVLNRTTLPFVSNDYLGRRPTTVRGGDISSETVSHIIEEIILNEEKNVELVLAPF